jgi:hypothetical protein
LGQKIGLYRWAPVESLPADLQTTLDKTQPWVNDAETILCYNRRGEDANTQLLCSARANKSAKRNLPKAIRMKGIASSNGATVWGEPCFTHDNKLYFVRFDTSVTKWKSELFKAVRQGDGSYGSPRRLIFK